VGRGNRQREQRRACRSTARLIVAVAGCSALGRPACRPFLDGRHLPVGVMLIISVCGPFAPVIGCLGLFTRQYVCVSQAGSGVGVAARWCFSQRPSRRADNGGSIEPTTLSNLMLAPLDGNLDITSNGCLLLVSWV
jgi:hypothetical protein